MKKPQAGWAWGGKVRSEQRSLHRQQVAALLDDAGDATLVLGREAGDAAGEDLARVGDVAGESLIVRERDLRRVKALRLRLGGLGGRSHSKKGRRKRRAAMGVKREVLTQSAPIAADPLVLET